MITREHVKQDIDRLPDDVVKQIYLFISVIRPQKPVKKRIRAFRLKGQFDQIHIRTMVYV